MDIHELESILETDDLTKTVFDEQKATARLQEIFEEIPQEDGEWRRHKGLTYDQLKSAITRARDEVNGVTYQSIQLPKEV